MNTITKQKKVSYNLKMFLFDNGLQDVFYTLQNDISNKDYFDFSYADLSKISYLKGDRIEYAEENGLIWDEKHRKDKAFHCKIGKLISDKIDNATIQKISGLLFARKKEHDYKIELTSDICYYYLQDNYENSQGNLGSSCMRYSELQEAIKFYESISPEKVELAIIKNNDGKLLARALLWHNVECEGNKINYMDRIYTNNDNLKEIYYKYMKDNDISIHYENNNYNMTLNINIDSDMPMPYMDTFSGYSYNGYLTNRSSDVSLDSTEGNPIESRYTCYNCGCALHEDEVCYSDDVGDYLCDDCGIYIEDDGIFYLASNCIEINCNWYYKESDKIIYSELDNNYILLDEAIYLEDEEDYIHQDSDCIYSDIENKYFSLSYADKNLVKSKYHDDYILKDNDDIVFSEYHQDYLLKTDSHIVYSKHHQDYFIENDVIYIESENDYFIENDDCIYFDDVTKKWRHKQLVLSL